jgi:hypothetical protein
MCHFPIYIKLLSATCNVPMPLTSYNGAKEFKSNLTTVRIDFSISTSLSLLHAIKLFHMN